RPQDLSRSDPRRARGPPQDQRVRAVQEAAPVRSREALSRMSEPRAQGDHERFIPGHVVAGRYRVIEQIGRGGMGEVYRAVDIKIGQPVALKFLPHELSEDSARLKALFEEVRLARQISHPYVCRVHDLEETNGL